MWQVFVFAFFAAHSSAQVLTHFNGTLMKGDNGRAFPSGASAGALAFFTGGDSASSATSVDVFHWPSMLWSPATLLPTPPNAPLSGMAAVSVTATKPQFAVFAGGGDSCANCGNQPCPVGPAPQCPFAHTYESAVTAYDENSAQHILPALGTPRSFLAGAAVGSFIIFTGGLWNSPTVGQTPSNAVDIYNYTGGNWVKVSTSLVLLQARFSHAAAASGKFAFFACGQLPGSGQPSTTNTIEIFDFSNPLAPSLLATPPLLSQPRTSLAGASVGNLVFFAGGFSTSGFSTAFDMCDAETLTCSVPITLKQKRAWPAMAASGSLVIVAGGYIAGPAPNYLPLFLDAIEVFDVSTKTPRSLPFQYQLAQGRDAMATAVIGGLVIFAAGVCQSVSNVVDFFSSCSPGQMLNVTANQCLSCAPGTFSPSSGTTHCSLCPSGSFSSGTAQSACAQCTAGI